MVAFAAVATAATTADMTLTMGLTDGHNTSNHGGFVDEVMRRVAKLAPLGEYASAQIFEALDEGEAAYQAKQTRLMDRGVLDGDSEGAAQLLVRKGHMEAGGQVPFIDQRLLRSTHYEKGRDKGIALDLKVSTDLAQMTVARARTADERGAALNNLGNVELAFFVKNRVSKHLDTA